MLLYWYDPIAGSRWKLECEPSSLCGEAELMATSCCITLPQ